jgi:PDZ domain-containing protein
MTEDDRTTSEWARPVVTPPDGSPAEPPPLFPARPSPVPNEPRADGAAGKGEPARLDPTGRTRHRWPWVLFVAVVAVVAVASRWNLDYFALTPGSAQSVQQFITVPADKSHPVKHPVLLTDVEEARVTALSYLYFKLNGNADLLQVNEITGGTPPGQLNAQGELEMSQAEASAKTAALRRLGYSVTATPSGSVIFGTFPGTPAYSVLHVGDVVTAVNGVVAPNAEALTKELARHHSGETITLTVKKGGTAAPAPVAVTLKETVVDLGGGRTAKVDLGIQPEDQVDFTYPFPVSINVTNIGGPSAGLAMTIGVVDALTSGSVTGKETVAATGTIDSSGNVGDVGGVAQKTVAVENAGATIFMVPPEEYKAAMSKDRPGLKIYAVSTLDQALKVLAAHGGAVPPVPAQSSPSSTTAG